MISSTRFEGFVLGVIASCILYFIGYFVIVDLSEEKETQCIQACNATGDSGYLYQRTCLCITPEGERTPLL